MIQTNKFVGIDVAKKDFYACFDEQSESKKFNNTALGINSFVRHLSGLNFQNQDTVIGVESTGSYHLRLCVQCSNLGLNTAAQESGQTAKQPGQSAVEKQTAASRC